MRILITGATGYVGGLLLPRLLENGHEVSCMVRNASRLGYGPVGVRIVEADALRPGSLPSALQGIEAAYYLIHSMGGGSAGFEERDRRAAKNFATAAKQAGVKRIIYLGGLSSQASQVSAHLKSRQETGAVLREFGPALTEFRAGIIVGNGSLSFEIIRCLTERLPVMVCPRWVMTRTQPIAVGDVLDYLVAALDVPESAGEIVEIGGASIETYRSMMLTYARIRRLRRWLLRVPILTPRLSSYWLNLVTPFPAAITRPLIEGLRTEVICSSDRAGRLFPEIIPMRYRAAVEEAVRRTLPDRITLERWFSGASVEMQTIRMPLGPASSIRGLSSLGLPAVRMMPSTPPATSSLRMSRLYLPTKSRISASGVVQAGAPWWLSWPVASFQCR